MSSWTPELAQKYKEAFYAFLNSVEIKSKEHETWIVLGNNLYGGQQTVIEQIFTSLGEDIHDFKILKSRQLGISTIVRALMLFWMGIFELTGALVFDSSQHLDEARVELLDMLERLPANFRFPRKSRDNRYSLQLENRSRVNLLAAGTKESKSGKALGAGSAISMWHRSELCNYYNIAGLEHLKHSRARNNPNRLFIDESTALGPNVWKDIWDEAMEDHHCRCIFVGWWSHPGQVIEKTDPDFEVYGVMPLTEEERERIKEVYRLYGHEITPEQLAWIRRENNPVGKQSGDADADFSASPERLQQQPWTADDAFQMTGAIFFEPTVLTKQMNVNASKDFKTYSYMPGVEFTDFRVFPAHNAKSIELKVWKPPLEESVYIVAADVAFGYDEKNDRSTIQVLRVFADGIDQEAEYAYALVNTRQFAWVVASIEAWYAGDKSDVYRIIELNGPGESVWRELRDLPKFVASGYFGHQTDEQKLRNIQKNVKNYFYTRSDSILPGRSYHWKTTTQLKIAIMERLRDFTSNGMLRIRSQDTLEEMRTISREGDSIGPANNYKDDRVMALAMGVRYWDEVVRRRLVASKMTRNADESKRRMNMVDQVKMYNDAQFDAFMASKGAQRRAVARAALRQRWRG